MPNPLLGAVRLNTGKPADDRPHAIPPVPEHYAGENFPYRGTETHGVPVHASGEPLADLYEDNASGTYEPAPEPEAVVPVRIVDVSGRELRRFRTGQEILDSTTASIVRMLVGRNPARTSVSIKNTGAQTMYIGETESVAAYTGYPIPAGVEKVFSHEDAIYAVAVSGQATTVAMLEEFTVRER